MNLARFLLHFIWAFQILLFLCLLWAVLGDEGPRSPDVYLIAIYVGIGLVLGTYLVFRGNKLSLKKFRVGFIIWLLVFVLPVITLVALLLYFGGC